MFSGLVDLIRRDMLARHAADDATVIELAEPCSFEGRDAFVASGTEVGVREGDERLDELLASPEPR